jgi:hypothetical protein
MDYQPRSTNPSVGGQRQAGANVRRDFFVYGVNFLALAPAAATSSAIQIQADSDFELQKLAFFADIAGGTETEATRGLPLVTLQITDTGTGRQVFSIPVPIPAIMGDGRIPFILPTTKIFSSNASVTFDVVNYSAATTYNLRLLLIGSKLFRFG